MKIFVSVKQVPARDSTLRVDTSGEWLDESGLSFEMNEPDAYALEEALQLRDKAGGEVVVVCAGPDRATSTIREALAKGADRAIHIRQEGASATDSLTTGQLLAKALQSETPDLILTGLQSDDLGYGQTGVVMAELLGMAHATIVMEIEIAGAGLLVKRELEDGWFQHVHLPFPAVVTVQSGIKKLRYATLMGIKKAKSKEVKTIDANSLQLEAYPALQVERVYLPERKKQTQMLTGDPRQAAAKLVEKLRFEARVL